MAVVDLEPAQALEQIKEAIKGEIQFPGSDAFVKNMGHGWNKADLRKPIAIVQVADTADVSVVIQFAARAGLTVVPAGGRHSNIWAGRRDGALVIDLSRINNVTVDKEKRIATVGGGSQLKHLDEECYKYKLHTTAGHNQTTGVGGLTTGGGFGYLARTHGMAIDLLESVEIVTADGSIIEASETSSPDLFWAVRGGGGNFGIVTRFTFKLYPIDRVWFCNAVWPWPLAEAIIEYTKEKDWVTNICEEASVSFMLARDPQSGQPAIIGMFTVVGETDAEAEKLGQATFAEFFEKFPPVFKAEEPQDYLAVQRSLGEKAPYGKYLERGIMTKNESADMITVLKNFVEGWKGPGFTALLMGGGAIRRKQATDTAWYQRDFNWWIISMAKLDDDVDEDTLAKLKDEVNAFSSSLDPYRLSDYLSVVDGTAPARSLQSYFGPNADKVRAIKTQWDPRNVFCHNRNVTPLESQ